MARRLLGPRQEEPFTRRMRLGVFVAAAALGVPVVVLAQAQSCQPNIATVSCKPTTPPNGPAEGGGHATFGGPPECREGIRVFVLWTEIRPADPDREPPLDPTFCSGQVVATLSTPTTDRAARTYGFQVKDDPPGMKPDGTTCDPQLRAGCTLTFSAFAQHVNPSTGTITTSATKGPCETTVQ